MAKDIVCHTISCSGNIIARGTIDISESLETAGSVMTGEGIIGVGCFSARNAVAPEFFEFSGDVSGKVVELE